MWEGEREEPGILFSLPWRLVRLFTEECWNIVFFFLRCREDIRALHIRLI